MIQLFSLWFAGLNETMSDFVVEVSELNEVNPV